MTAELTALTRLQMFPSPWYNVAGIPFECSMMQWALSRGSNDIPPICSLMRCPSKKQNRIDIRQKDMTALRVSISQKVYNSQKDTASGHDGIAPGHIKGPRSSPRTHTNASIACCTPAVLTKLRKEGPTHRSSGHKLVLDILRQ